MDNTVTILHWDSPGLSELNLRKIVEFFGGKTRLVKLDEELAGYPNRLASAVERCQCLISSAATLARLARNNGETELRSLLANLSRNVLVYGFDAAAWNGVLAALSQGTLTVVESLTGKGRTIRVAANSRQMCGQFSGLEFEHSGKGNFCAFVTGGDLAGPATVASIDGKPFFAKFQSEKGRLLLLAGQEIVDIDVNVLQEAQETPILKFFPGFVPVLMFLRSSAEKAFWHNDAPRACLTIDDPLLQRRYGFLEHERLLEAMEAKGFCTSIAFIPWNFDRSQRKTAKLFAAHADRYSLCVHGCDHTWGEFAGEDYPEMRERAEQALERMNLHQKLSGVGFDDVMVFPQGLFSTAGVKALKASGYLASANSNAHPVDATEEVTLRDLLDVAVTRFSNFPLFTRRYARFLAEVAFDLFLGKPALLVEHHAFFRDGYDEVTEAVEKLHEIEPALKWDSLGNICMQASLKKTGANAEIEARFFTDRFTLRNDDEQPHDYLVSRSVPADEVVKELTCNGRRSEFSKKADAVKTRVRLSAGQTVTFRMESKQEKTKVAARRPNRVYQAKVFLRRNLSDLRVNYLDRSGFLRRSDGPA